MKNEMKFNVDNIVDNISKKKYEFVGNIIRKIKRNWKIFAK